MRHLRTVLAGVATIALTTLAIARTTYGPTTKAKDAVPPWAGAGVYVFDAYVLDLTKRTERFNPMVFVGVRDCSDSSYFCLSARQIEETLGIIHFVVPRRCTAFKLGEKWSKEGVETEVLAIKRPTKTPLDLHFVPPDKIYYLGTAAFPGVVYEYWPNDGIVAIYFSLGSDNLVERARKDGNLDKFERDGRHRWSLTTFDPLASCTH